MKKLLPMICLLILTGCGEVTGADGCRWVTQREAQKMMREEQNYIILDVRSMADYRAGHIPGAINLPEEFLDREPVTGLPDKDQLIFLYSADSKSSRQAAKKLAGLGYTNVVEFGGFQSWTGETVGSDG